MEWKKNSKRFFNQYFYAMTGSGKSVFWANLIIKSKMFGDKNNSKLILYTDKKYDDPLYLDLLNECKNHNRDMVIYDSPTEEESDPLTFLKKFKRE